MSRVNILFPVETINRELDYRLFLAGAFASEANEIFIGQHDAIARLSAFMTGGVYLGKHIFRSLAPTENWERYGAIKQRGFRFIHLHEEGAVFYGGKSGWERGLSIRLDASRLAADDYICNWGDFQRDYYGSRAPQLGSRNRTTGHPRFALYAQPYREYFQEDAARLRAEHGRFILINSNLSVANSGLGHADTFSSVRAYDSADVAKRTPYIEAWSHHTRTLADFVQLINTLSVRFPDLNVVVRPHPSEDQDFYRVIFRQVPNVRILHEGSVAPWLLACELMIHDGCTTGIEAHLAGTKIINFKSTANVAYDCFLPNLFGTRCTTSAEVVATVESFLAGDRPGPVELPPEATSLFSDFEVPGFDRTLAALEDGQGDVNVTPTFDEKGFVRREAVHRASWVARGVARRFFPEKLRRERLHTSMFKGFEADDIDRKVSKIRGILGRKLHWRDYGPELFSVRSEP